MEKDISNLNPENRLVALVLELDMMKENKKIVNKQLGEEISLQEEEIIKLAKEMKKGQLSITLTVPHETGEESAERDEDNQD